MIERLKTLQEKPLSTYHQGVINDFVRAVKKYKRLSPRQEVFLSNIESEYTDDAITKRQSVLRKLLTDTKYRKEVKLVCEYYRSTGYYRSTYQQTLSFLSSGDMKDAPNPRALNKMMNNKYAQNIIESSNGEPKFTVGELVQIRKAFNYKNVKYEKRVDCGADAYIVLEVDSSPISRTLNYCNVKGGSRWYRLLAMGSTSTIEVIERELKRPTKKAMGKK